MKTPGKNFEINKKIWSLPKDGLKGGAWLWWFWLFFIHDKDTKKTGKCRQLMILWSVKKDPSISVNDLNIEVNEHVVEKNGACLLNGAAACWYFDGKKMHENFVLEKSAMFLVKQKGYLFAPGKTPSRFSQEGRDKWKVHIRGKKHSFDFLTVQKDKHKFVGPVHGHTKFANGMFEIEGTRIERLELSGEEVGEDGKSSPIFGTAYFQKIYLAAPPPQWYWGLYHFDDGSIATYMQAYSGRAMLKDNGISHNLKIPTLSLIKDILIYHAPSGKVFEGHMLSVKPVHIGNGLYAHELKGGGNDFEFEGVCRAYAHACWTFGKKISALPVKSIFRYNEYPAVFEKLRITPKNGGKEILLKNGWGNMENSWGFLL